MSLLDVSIVAVALPSMQRGLETGPSGVQWVVSGYALTFGLALVPALVAVACAALSAVAAPPLPRTEAPAARPGQPERPRQEVAA